MRTRTSTETRAILSFVGPFDILIGLPFIIAKIIGSVITVISIFVPGVFEFDASSFQMLIFPKHRDHFGIRWRCRQKLCKVPLALAPHHVTRRRRKERTLTLWT